MQRCRRGRGSIESAPASRLARSGWLRGWATRGRAVVETSKSKTAAMGTRVRTRCAVCAVCCVLVAGLVAWLLEAGHGQGARTVVARDQLLPQHQRPFVVKMTDAQTYYFRLFQTRHDAVRVPCLARIPALANPG